MPQTIRVHRLGLISYHEAWEWQRRSAAAVREGAPEAIAVLQHPPVYTLGRRGHRENLLFAPADAEVVQSDRGGDVTYHGPGQLVAYPILNLRRRNLGAADYVRLLEEAMIRTAAAFGVAARRLVGRPGVWVEVIPPLSGGRGGGAAFPHDETSFNNVAEAFQPRRHPPNNTPSSTAPLLTTRGAPGTASKVPAKLGAVGVRVQGGVTTHGLALNVSTDLSRFDAIVPCGLAGIRVTSLAQELGYTPSIEDAEDAMLAAFEALLDCSFEAVSDAVHYAFRHSQALSSQGEGRVLPGRTRVS